MSNGSKIVNRYSDAELEEFKQLITAKLEKATAQYSSLIEQIKEITENTSGDFTKDITDFSSSQIEVEMLNSMATRQKLYIQDLQNALVRIRNKSYGICSVTGELIEKKRLLAVPTTTKSVQAKQVSELSGKTYTPSYDEGDSEDIGKKKAPEIKKQPVIITKVIKKPSAKPGGTARAFDEDDELDEILKDLDSITEGPEVTDFDTDLDDISDDDGTDFIDEPYDDEEDYDN